MTGQVLRGPRARGQQARDRARRGGKLVEQREVGAASRDRLDQVEPAAERAPAGPRCRSTRRSACGTSASSRARAAVGMRAQARAAAERRRGARTRRPAARSRSPSRRSRDRRGRGLVARMQRRSHSANALHRSDGVGRIAPASRPCSSGRRSRRTASRRARRCRSSVVDEAVETGPAVRVDERARTSPRGARSRRRRRAPAACGSARRRGTAAGARRCAGTRRPRCSRRPTSRRAGRPARAPSSGRERRTQAQRRVASAADQLEVLRDEFDLADAAASELDVDARVGAPLARRNASRLRRAASRRAASSRIWPCSLRSASIAPKSR